MKITRPMSIFGFEDYRQFLKNRIEENQELRGYKQRLARAAHCQPSFLSQVLSLRMHFSRDHAAEVAGFLGLDEGEEECFILLVDFARASSPRLKTAIKKRLDRLRSDRHQPATRVRASQMRDEALNLFYYSSWYCSAVHMLLSIPEYRSAASIARRLELSVSVIEQCLLQLQSGGLARKEGAHWLASGESVHLAADSPLNEINQTHWRLKAASDIQKKDDRSIHYSSVFTIARRDWDQLRELLIRQLTESRDIIVASPSEELFCLNLDFFRV